jgi:hypothetical protein
MNNHRRCAAVGLVFGFGALVLTVFAPRSAEAVDKLRHAPENATTVTIKDVTIDQVDEAGGTISVSFGKKKKPTKLVNVPLGKGVRVVASHVLPGSMNHLPFRWDDVKRRQGKVVSVRLYAAAGGLSVVSICAGND